MEQVKRDVEFLNDLLMAYSPSSYEVEGTKVWEKRMKEVIDPTPAYTDNIGNSVFSIGKGEGVKILVSAHIDEIAMMVGLIEEDGMIVLQNLAGVDKKVLPGAQLRVRNDEGEWIKGIVHKAPIHIDGRGKDSDSACKLEQLRLDIGADGKDEVESKYHIHPGSLVVFERNVIPEFGANKIVGNALDDKIGVYIVAKVAENLANIINPKDVLDGKGTIYFAACTQEESGLRGATVAAHNINPDISIDIDVTFAVNGGLVSKSKYGDVKLGEGPVIEYGQDKSLRLCNLLVKSAENTNVKFQRGVARCGGTNTDTIQLSSSDCETCLVSIPNLSMHTQNETCDWRDVEGAIKMISDFVSQIFNNY